MNDRSNLIFCLVASVSLLVLMIWWQCRPGRVTVGMALCYLASLMSIHFFGAWVNVLPSNSLLNAHVVAVGFRECVLGMVAFVGGVLAMEKLLSTAAPTAPVSRLRSGSKRTMKSNGFVGNAGEGDYAMPPPSTLVTTNRRIGKSTRLQSKFVTDRRAFRKMPMTYIMAGLFCLVCLIPISRGIPSIGAVINCGAYLIVGGMALQCWRCWEERQTLKMLAWMSGSVAFPLFTMLTMGFLGFGTYAALVLFMFVFAFYRPRWHSLLAMTALLYIGLSVFVNYMQGREDFRDAVWGQAAYSRRFEQLDKMFSHFEWFDTRNESHLAAVDERLNQNYLVGLVIDNLNSGAVPYAKGSTFVEALEALVPRIIWPDKPVHAGSPAIVSNYSGLEFNEFTSVGVGQVMEFYINFGRWGVLLGFLGFGLIIRWLDQRAAKELRNRNMPGFIRWFLPVLAFMQVGGSLVEVAGTFAASTVLVFIINRFVIGNPSSRSVPRVVDHDGADNRQSLKPS